jgi:hypothetical protein
MITATDTLTISKSLSSRSDAVRPSTSALQFNGASESLEMKDRNQDYNEEAAASPVTSTSNLNGHRLRAGLQLASVCYSMFLAGWNDGTTGPLLPRIQKFYKVCPISLCRIVWVTI